MALGHRLSDRGQGQHRHRYLTLTELGYDIRKPGVTTTDPRGSTCGGGAPRFDVTTRDGKTYFIDCGAATTTTTGQGWLRLRFGGGSSIMAYPQLGGSPVNIANKKVRSIDIVMDVGQDVGPEKFGLAVLDNIDVNGTLVGHGASGAHGSEGQRGPEGGHGHGGHGGGH